MNKVLLLLAVPALIFGALLLLGFLALVLAFAPRESLIPALIMLALCGVVLYLKLRGRNSAGSLDGESALLPSASKKGGLL